MLYHYTNRDGLIGILRSRSVWATDVRYLNDSSEFSYAVGLASTKLDAIRGRVRQRQDVEALTAAIDTISAMVPSVFAFSLSAGADLLSQWRSYCGPANGYAIGFSHAALKKLARKARWILKPVVYSPGAQEEILNHVEVEAVDRGDPLQNASAFAKEYARSFLRRAPFLKEPSFREEGEWRVVAYVGPREARTVMYRSGRSSLVPYVSVSLWGTGASCPIRQILIGPSPRPRSDQEAVSGLCRRQGLSPEILTSGVPYRSW